MTNTRTTTLSDEQSRTVTRTRVASLLGALALGALLALPAGAQDATNMGRAASEETTSLEIFVTRYYLDAQGGDDRPEIGGGGARLMTNLGRRMRSTNTWFTRSSLGAFVVYTAKQDQLDAKTLHVGGQIDAHLLPRPLLSFLDPFISVSAGAFRTTATVPGGLLSGDEEVSNTDLAISPGAGTHFHLAPNISIRGDLRDVIIFGDQTTHNFEASLGLSLNF